MALDAPPDALTWSNGAWVAGDGSDPEQVKTIEAIALYAHGTGALPPGVEGGLDAQTVYRD
jgi:carbon-monoxide dehydrogenase large subunit